MTNGNDRQLRAIESGWTTKATSGFNDHVGTVWARRDDDGRVNGYVATESYLNIHRVVHGSMLANFADTLLGRLVDNSSKPRPSATVQLNFHYVEPFAHREFVEGGSSTVRVTGSLASVTGTFGVESNVVATADGVWKILRTGQNGWTSSGPDRSEGTNR